MVTGQIQNATLGIAGEAVTEDIFVMRGQNYNLLSKRACQQLKLLKPSEVVYNIEGMPDFRAEFHNLFQGIDCLETHDRISLLTDAVTVCLYTARRVAHPLLENVKETLNTMKEQEAISEVNEPTSWCSGIVCIAKADGKVCICVDLTPLNKVVQCEIHPMATVARILPKSRDLKYSAS